jgi:hypothetical protein
VQFLCNGTFSYGKLDERSFALLDIYAYSCHRVDMYKVKTYCWADRKRFELACKFVKDSHKS